MLFAHLQRTLKLDRLRLRGPNGAKGEFLLAATAQNLRKLVQAHSPFRLQLRRARPNGRTLPRWQPSWTPLAAVSDRLCRHRGRWDWP